MAPTVTPAEQGNGGRFTGRVVIVTGGAKGIDGGCATVFCAAGGRVPPRGYWGEYHTVMMQEQARKHPIVASRPAPGFFEGALLGNGGLGAVVTTRPDAVVVRFGHNNVWDIRLAEANREKLGSFREVFEKIKAIPAEYVSLEDDPWYRDYCAIAQENYRKPYPRPMPCGSLILGFDRRRAEVLGHRLDIATGQCEVQLLVDGAPAALELFVDQERDRLWLRFVDARGASAAAPFDRVRLLPDPDTPKEFPPHDTWVDPDAGALAFRQLLPFQGHRPAPHAAHPKDQAFRLAVRIAAGLSLPAGSSGAAPRRSGAALEQVETALSTVVGAAGFIALAQIDEGPATTVSDAAAGVAALPSPDAVSFETARAATGERWREFWGRSGVALDDQFLEQIWYWNLYFLNCAVKPGVTCPGLFANWSYRAIGSAWHGDYHMNYNTQQPFWAVFSSNHVEKHLPYVDLVEHLLPVSRRWAEEYYGLRGAYFPHSAYPVEMSMLPYPVPTWGWEVCETPWTVQSLWWHYRYTLDTAFLAGRAFGPIRDAVRFLVDYLRRPEARGPQWGDDRYHVFPTVPPELYGLAPGFAKNADCLVDLTLTRFAFEAYLEACTVLSREQEESALIDDVRDVRDHLPAYPTAESRRGRVFVSVPGEDPEVVYNCPVGIMTVFPGEAHGLHSPPGEYETAANSYRNHRNEGGNDLVLYHLAGARLGLLDLERFKRQVAYCLLPNGTCTDMVLQTGGRYQDTTPFEFMARMGVWFENFALPAVINECLLQSYTGVLRFFPNWPAERRASFRTLRAAGGFLVSAAFAGGEVTWVEVDSEAGAALRFHIPWPGGARCIRGGGEQVLTGEVAEVETSPGERLRLLKSERRFPASAGA